MCRTNTYTMATALCLLLCCTAGSYADLQNVTVGGEVRIRGNYWVNTFNPTMPPGLVRPEARIPGAFFGGRAIGDVIGGQSVVSYYDWDGAGSDYAAVGQRTLLGVNADFTDGVSARIALESFDFWGEDFRSDYVTGADRRGLTNDDVEVYEAYVEAAEVLGLPLRLRVGRQELTLGRGWLVGNASGLPEFRGLSFDAVRLTYTLDDLAFDAFWAKLAERSPVEADGDTDLYGIYARYSGVEQLALEAYWLFLRDAEHLEDTPGEPVRDRIEEWLGVDDYGVTRLHTVGLRVAGTWSGFDLEAEAAYQFGEADRVGRLFRPYTYGDDGAEYDAFAATLELGYTFDTAWQPRVFLGGAWFDGEDNRDLSFAEWLNPFRRPEASVSFNRLFSNVTYSAFLDEVAQASNFWTLRAGVAVTPTERLLLEAHAACFRAIDPFDLPRPLIIVNGAPLGLVSPFTFLTREADDDLGWETQLAATYTWSDDLEVKAGWAHLFTGDGLGDGSYVDYNGLLSNRGTGTEDADYLYWQCLVRF